MEKLIIIGSGPAGYTAALYAARADLNPLVFVGKEPGGQLMWTTTVENYPGFPEGILGPDLMEKLKKQAERFGARVESKTVIAVDFSKQPFKIKVNDKDYEAEAVIISTGSVVKRLGLESETALWGKGVSACATCDGPLFKNKEIIVIGGGDAAMEEANFLTKFASKVTVIHRRDEFRASKIMVERAEKNPKIDFIFNSEVQEVLGAEEGRVTGVKLKNNKTDEITDFRAQGMFVAIGHRPSTDIFKGQLELDEIGYVVRKPDTSETSVAGVFAAGDVADRRYRQAVTAAGAGCRAAIDAERWLEACQG